MARRSRVARVTGRVQALAGQYRIARPSKRRAFCRMLRLITSLRPDRLTRRNAWLHDDDAAAGAPAFAAIGPAPADLGAGAA